MGPARRTYPASWVLDAELRSLVYMISALEVTLASELGGYGSQGPVLVRRSSTDGVACRSAGVRPGPR